MRRACRHQIGQHIFGKCLAHGFHQHADRAATGQAYGKGGLIADAKGQKPRGTILHRLKRLGDHRALNTAARHRPHDLPLAGNRQLAAGLPGGRAPSFHNCGQRGLAAGAVPFQRNLGNLVVVHGSSCWPHHG